MFTTHTLETAPEASRPILEGAVKMFGGIPVPLARHASSPALLEAFDRGNAIWHTTAFSDIEREVVVMVVAKENGCSFCVRLHTKLLESMNADPALVEALRAGTPLADKKLEALATFTRGVLANRGKVDPTAFFSAGYDARHALDVVVGIATYTLTTYANRLVGV